MGGGKIETLYIHDPKEAGNSDDKQNQGGNEKGNGDDDHFWFVPAHHRLGQLFLIPICHQEEAWRHQ